MHNWDYDLKTADKKSTKFIRWKLERLINYGLGGEKIDKKLLKKHWKYLKLDPEKRKFLKHLLK